MAISEIGDWLDEFSQPDCIWLVKRLSGNDTLANKSHQAGPYIPKDFMFRVFPAVNEPSKQNPDVRFSLYVDSHPDHRLVRGVWYNNKYFGGTRDETRLTNFGGARSAVLDPDSTGALTIFSFSLNNDGSACDCHAWVCRHATEEEVVEDRIGPVEPGEFLICPSGQPPTRDFFLSPEVADKSCRLTPDQIPDDWLLDFPSGETIVRKTVEMRPSPELAPDRRLLRRRECEFEIFRSLEEAVELPSIKKGFDDINAFIAKAQSILQRRKARSGRSLELHTRAILKEEGLEEGADFSHQPESEQGKCPDFLFPSEQAYKNASFPEDKLMMLAVKTTCKDRWRQVINEADRIKKKHLLTLQEGVSENQFREMTAANVQLVVPEPLFTKFPSDVRPHLQTLENFIGDVRILSM